MNRKSLFKISNREKIDCLFIHAPDDTNAKRIFGMHIAMGVFALADYLQKNGYSTKILHLGVEKISNNNFSLGEYLKTKDVHLIGISLQWSFQLHVYIKIINEIKSIQPRAKIVLGGFMASFFSDDIINNIKDVDFIIKGDAEIPILKLMNELSKTNPKFNLIPNLTWKEENKIINNEQTFVADESDIDSLNFSNFKLVENFETYLKVPLELNNYSKDSLMSFNTFFLCAGRGCPVNCSFCGGAKISQKIINRRDRVIFRSHENVLNSIRDALRVGVDRLYVSFDPEPKRKYYIDLFRLIRKNSITISMVFECWSLPTPEFIDEFKKTFSSGNYSRIVLSPETGSERLRRLNKGFFYTNKKLLEMLQFLKNKKIFSEIYFSYPLPYENRHDEKLTTAFIKHINNRLNRYAKILVLPIYPDPASPMFLYPAKYGMIKDIDSVDDCCYFHKIENLITEAYKNFLHGNLQGAIEIANKAKSLIKGDIHYRYFYKFNQIHLILGLSYEKTGQYRKAINELRIVGDIFAENPKINFSLFNCYRKLKRPKEAYRELKKGILKSKRKDCLCWKPML